MPGLAVFALVLGLASCATPSRASLTPGERLWLERSGGPLEVLFGYEAPPYAYHDDGGGYVGLLVEFLAEIEALAGIEFKTRNFGTWNDLIEYSKAGRDFIVVGITRTPARAEFLTFTDPFLKVPYVVVIREGDKIAEMSDLVDREVCTVARHMVNDFLTRRFPRITRAAVSDNLAGLRAVSAGECDAMVANWLDASFLISSQGMTNLKVAGESGYVDRLSAAVSTKNPKLFGILDKVVDQIDVNRRQQIYHKWLHGDSNEISSIPLGMVGAGGIFAAALLGLFGWWLANLRRQVRLQTQRLQKSEASLRETQRIASLGNWEWDLRQNRVRWSDEMYEICGLEAATEPDIKRVRDLVLPEDLPAFDGAVKRTRQGDVAQSIEYRIRKTNGQIRHLHARAGAVFDASGAVTTLLGTLQDVTEQQESEQNLNEAQRIARTGHWIWNPRNGDLFWSRELLRIFAQGPEFLPSYETFITAIHPDDQTLVETAVADALADIHPYAIDARVICASGEVRNLHLHGEVTFDEDKKPLVMRGTVTDITDRKRTERALQESESKYRELIDGTPDILYRTDIEGRIVFISPSVCELSGYTQGEAIGMSMVQEVYAAPEDRDRLLAELRKNGFVRNFEARLKRKDGSTWWASTNAHYSKDPQGNIQGLEGITRDISDLKETERTLRTSEAHFRSLIEALPDLIFVLDTNGTILKVNRMAGGHEENDVLGQKSTRFVAPGSRDKFDAAVRAAIDSGQLQTLEIPIELPDGMHYFLGRLNPTRLPEAEGSVLLIATDISEQKQAEERLRRSQKMEAVGQLTGGIAHDFNNILGIILGNIELLEREIALHDKSRQRLETIKKSAQRAADLTHQLLGFSRRDATRAVTTDVNRVIAEMDSLIARSLTPLVRVEQQLSQELWRTKIDPGDLQDALLNLVINARDAMPGGGAFTLTTANKHFDETFRAGHADIAPGEYVEINVADDGQGIPMENLEHIFEPFFSTKDPGRGTGLGLAMVFGFAKRSGGAVRVDSQQGRGTAFRIYLPRSVVADELERPRDVSTGESPRGKEVILVVDDEEQLLELSESCLHELGYRVLTAANGAQALEHLAREPDIALLFSDVVMPGGMNGYELAERAKARRPDLKVLLTSGYAEEKGHSGDLLRKPYSQAELARRLRALLGEHAAAEAGLAAPAQSPTSVIEWTEDLSVGTLEMDADHRILLALLNRAHTAAVCGDEQQCVSLLEELRSYTQKHFQREEVVMSVCGYPGLHNHRQVHRLLVKQVEKMRGQLSAQQVADFFRQWLTDHILGMDKAYGRYCVGKEALIEGALLERAPIDPGPATGQGRSE